MSAEKPNPGDAAPQVAYFIPVFSPCPLWHCMRNRSLLLKTCYILFTPLIILSYSAKGPGFWWRCRVVLVVVLVLLLLHFVVDVGVGQVVRMLKASGEILLAKFEKYSKRRTEPDFTGWAAEGREGRSWDAWRPRSRPKRPPTRSRGPTDP